MTRVATAAIIGGTVSELTGGKFANGARTAALQRMFNGEGNMVAQKTIDERLGQIRAAALNGNLSLEDANFYYHHSRDPSYFNAENMLVARDPGSYKFTAAGKDWSVHGNVAMNADGTIKPEPYDFDYKN